MNNFFSHSLPPSHSCCAVLCSLCAHWRCSLKSSEWLSEIRWCFNQNQSWINTWNVMDSLAVLSAAGQFLSLHLLLLLLYQLCDPSLACFWDAQKKLLRKFFQSAAKFSMRRQEILERKFSSAHFVLLYLTTHNSLKLQTRKLFN